ncbi:hypothetical protein, partial [Acinetobacter sp.]|uniref:hypothetical protein n=1 Tax=Acinetobacter sp. TaxID=472 RepID=UPI002FCC041A
MAKNASMPFYGICRRRTIAAVANSKMPMLSNKNQKKKRPLIIKGLFRYLAEAVRFELTEDSHPR